MSSTSPAGNAHRWLFSRTAGLDQVVLRHGDDLRNLKELDPKLWVALACPAKGLEIEDRTLQLIDTDADGRIRLPEVLATVDWAVHRLKDPGLILEAPKALPLDAIDDSHADGAAILASARRILANLGRAEAAAITVADTSDTVRIFAQTRFNGDGVVPQDSAEDEALRAVIGEILAAIGGKPDRSGKLGIDQAAVDAFYGQLAAFDTWWKQGEDSSKAGGGVLPLGDATPAAAAALTAVRAKVEDFFARVRLAQFDPRATAAMNRSESEFSALAPKDLSTASEDIAALPLARVEPNATLPLTTGINPAWLGPMTSFREAVVKPLLGQDITSLSDADWGRIRASMAPYFTWQKGKAASAVEKLGIVRIRELLTGDSRAKITALIQQDLALAPEVAAIDQVDRLVRLARDLSTLLHNFVSFEDFYRRDRLAIFQAGTLYFDGRATELCMRVDDAGKHASLAPQSRTFLAYCDCTRKDGGKLAIVAAFTAGDAENLAAGRNGIFFDRHGRDWDATITKIVENPISVREAFWMPYKRVAALINQQIERLATARDKEMQAKMATGVEQAGSQVAQGQAAPAAPAAQQGPGIAGMVGILAAIGLAIGAIGTALATALAAFFGLSWWQMPLAIIGLILVISAPSCIIAWLKLRQRTLGPILDASGWAINGRVKITFPLGRILTTLHTLPPNAERTLDDPYAEKGIPWFRWALVLAIGAIAIGIIWFNPSSFSWIVD